MRQKDIKKKGLFNYKNVIIKKGIKYYYKVPSYFKMIMKKTGLYQGNKFW